MAQNPQPENRIQRTEYLSRAHLGKKPKQKSAPPRQWPEVSLLQQGLPKKEEDARQFVNLTENGPLAKKHWAEHLPKAYAKLVKANRLYQSLWHALALTEAALDALKESGLPLHQAWDQVRGEYLFPPAEDEGPSWLSPDVPELLDLLRGEAKALAPSPSRPSP